MLEKLKRFFTGRDTEPREWTENETQALIRLFNDGLQDYEIARFVGNGVTVLDVHEKIIELYIKDMENNLKV